MAGTGVPYEIIYGKHDVRYYHSTLYHSTSGEHDLVFVVVVDGGVFVAVGFVVVWLCEGFHSLQHEKKSRVSLVKSLFIVVP